MFITEEGEEAPTEATARGTIETADAPAEGAQAAEAPIEGSIYFIFSLIQNILLYHLLWVSPPLSMRQQNVRLLEVPPLPPVSKCQNLVEPPSPQSG